MNALLKLIPFRDYLYAAIAIAGVTYYNVHVHGLIEADRKHQEAAIALNTAKVLAEATTKIDELNKAHADDVATIEGNYERTIQADDAAHAADISRLQHLAAESGGSAPVGSAASSIASGDPGNSSLVGLGYVSEELASALRNTRSDLSACYAERDSLTGK